jgi:hypothetical protein
MAQRSLHQPCRGHRTSGKASDESKNKKDRFAVELTVDPVSKECSAEIRDKEADTDLREEGEIRTLADVGHQANNLIWNLRRF